MSDLETFGCYLFIVSYSGLLFGHVRPSQFLSCCVVLFAHGIICFSDFVALYAENYADTLYNNSRLLFKCNTLIFSVIYLCYPKKFSFGAAAANWGCCAKEALVDKSEYNMCFCDEICVIVICGGIVLELARTVLL